MQILDRREQMALMIAVVLQQWCQEQSRIVAT